MYLPLEYKDLDGNYVLVDVRTPEEFEASTIEGAINIPILDNEERKVVGTLYKEDVEKAKKLAIQIGAKKLPELYDKALELEAKYDRIIFFCARGGMRSGVLNSTLSSMGIRCRKLLGGYKSYRKYIMDELPKLNEDLTYIVLHGNTGVGKTEILKKLEADGYPVLDLEGCANHRGSLLGSVGLGSCLTQKAFDSNVYNKLSKIKSNYVFVEAESRRIGNVFIPEYIHKKMKEGLHIFVGASIDFRCDLIVNEYTKNKSSKEDIIFALDKLNKYISKDTIEEYKKLVEEEDYFTVTKELMIKYYDPMYTHTSDKYKYELKVEVDNIENTAKEIENWFETR